MKRKNRALRGMLTLAVVIALCMFFARTVQTMTTPKIQRISAAKGKLEQKLSLNGSIYFAETKEYKVDAARKLAVTVDQVMVRPGYYVNAGDVIFTAYAPSYEEKLEELQKKHDNKVTEYADELAAHLRLRQSSEQNDMYTVMMEKIEAYYDLRYQLWALCAREQYALPEDEEQWGMITDGSQSICTLSAQLKTAREEQDAAIQALTDVYNGDNPKVYRIGDTSFEYIKKKEKLRREIDELAQEILDFEQLNASVTTVQAPSSGYITAVEVKSGDSYDGSKAAFAMTQEDALPVLRVELTGVDKTIRAGNKAVLTESGTESEVTEVTTDADGKKYALIDLNSKVLKSAGGLARLLTQGQIPLTLVYKAQKSTTLLPASAVRSDGSGGYYVYIVNQTYGGILDSGGYTISKQAVTVLEKSDQVVSLSDDLSYREIADREDRALSDGQAVMDYVD